jgi:hypothetical protein
MVSRLRRFTAGFAGVAVGRRDSLVARRMESRRSGRVYPDGPHGAKTGRPVIDAGWVGRKRDRRWADSRCLITGASSGLGHAIAEHLVRAGARVVLTGRSTERLGAVFPPDELDHLGGAQPWTGTFERQWRDEPLEALEQAIGCRGLL